MSKFKKKMSPACPRKKENNFGELPSVGPRWEWDRREGQLLRSNGKKFFLRKLDPGEGSTSGVEKVTERNRWEPQGIG